MAPRLATVVPSLENGLIKDGGKTYIFPIRKGVKFHNGAVLTPEDVEYSFKKGLIFDPAGRPMWMLWEALFEVYSLDEFVEKIVGKPLGELLDPSTKEPLPQYRKALIRVYTDYIDPAIEKEESPLYAKAMGTGPFKLVEWDRAQMRVVLERFDDYWKGLANIKRVII